MRGDSFMLVVAGEGRPYGLCRPRQLPPAAATGPAGPSGGQGREGDGADPVYRPRGDPTDARVSIRPRSTSLCDWIVTPIAPVTTGVERASTREDGRRRPVRDVTMPIRRSQPNQFRRPAGADRSPAEYAAPVGAFILASAEKGSGVGATGAHQVAEVS